MHVKFINPQLQQFVEDQVKCGHFPSPEAVIEDAVARMMEEKITLTDDDIAAIRRSDEQFENGEYTEFQDFAQQMRKKYGII